MFKGDTTENSKVPYVGIGYMAAEAVKRKYGLTMKETDQLMLHLASLAKNGGKMNGVSAFTAFGAVSQAFDLMNKVFRNGGK